jgi:hypothetical protein
MQRDRLVGMGNKNTAKRESKKPAKKQPKVAPGRKREDFISQAPSQTIRP